MSKVDNIVDFIQAGIKAEALRQKAITNNVANIQTPGYRRLDIRFDELLANAMDADGKADLAEVIPEVYRPMKTPVQSNGNDVNLEMEVGEMVKNTLRHATYVKLLNKRYQQIEAAISVK